jgi:hypothetical protein
VRITKIEHPNFINYPSRNEINCKPLDEEQSKLFLNCMLNDVFNIDINSKVENLFFSKIIQKRIEVLDLPIKFTCYGMLMVSALCSTPGEVIILLCDCLYHYEGKRVSVNDISNLYPFGFYNEETVLNIIDNYMKARVHPWSQVY